ncbi:hypothetical protein llap_19879 [Limosa lapponica baueri]|uniref:Uncharacterized protein n=1 Tax=Limosa lapponica baueri TaxID=1758121 RepID=A0A2I0T7P4_LIMLA|nr:hypothetical protein llap_19879 [Limosa lapponica baueri]
MKGSYEGAQDVSIGPHCRRGSSETTVFHYVKHSQPRLYITPPKERFFCRCASARREMDVSSPLAVPLHSLDLGKKVTVMRRESYEVSVKEEDGTMAKLYEDANWSQKDLREPIGDIRKHVIKSKLHCFSLGHMKYYEKELCERKQEGHKLSFTDLWGLFIDCMLRNQESTHKLSDQQLAVNQGQNPLPIYLSLNVKDDFSTLDFKDVERSPTEMEQGRVDVSNCVAPYGTGLLTYTEENFNKLLNLCSYNILNNKHLILQALRTAVERKKRFKNCSSPQSCKLS